MRHQRLLLFLSAVVSVTLWTYACGDGTTEPTPYSSEPTTITVSPATAELVALDATVQMSAEVKDQNGWVMADGDVGEQRHRRGDRRRVRAGDGCGQRDRHDHGDRGIGFGKRDGDRGAGGQLCDGGAGGGELCGSGRSGRLTAEAFDANGHTVAGAEFSWETNDDAVATVDATGLATAVANGTATITATAGEASGSATVTVAQVVSAVAVAPMEANFEALGDTLRLTAEASTRTEAL